MSTEYVRGALLGEGTWGSVYEATAKVNQRKVAIKRIKGTESKLGINFTALREIKQLNKIRSDYILNVCGHPLRIFHLTLFDS